MDFHTLPRKDLQSLCKRNKIPANMTNVAMADALQALQTVEGLDEIKETQFLSPHKVETRTPKPPRTSQRTSVRRNAAVGDGAEDLIDGASRATTQRRATRTSSRIGGEEAVGKKEIVGIPLVEMPETPAAPTGRKIARARQTAKTPAQGKEGGVEATVASTPVAAPAIGETPVGVRAKLEEEKEGGMGLRSHYRTRQSSRRQAEDVDGVVPTTVERKRSTRTKGVVKMAALPTQEPEQDPVIGKVELSDEISYSDQISMLDSIGSVGLSTDAMAKESIGSSDSEITQEITEVNDSDNVVVVEKPMEEQPEMVAENIQLVIDASRGSTDRVEECGQLSDLLGGLVLSDGKGANDEVVNEGEYGEAEQMPNVQPLAPLEVMEGDSLTDETDDLVLPVHLVAEEVEEGEEETVGSLVSEFVADNVPVGAEVSDVGIFIEEGHDFDIGVEDDMAELSINPPACDFLVDDVESGGDIMVPFESSPPTETGEESDRVVPETLPAQVELIAEVPTAASSDIPTEAIESSVTFPETQTPMKMEAAHEIAALLSERSGRSIILEDVIPALLGTPVKSPAPSFGNAVFTEVLSSRKKSGFKSRGEIRLDDDKENAPTPTSTVVIKKNKGASLVEMQRLSLGQLKSMYKNKVSALNPISATTAATNGDGLENNSSMVEGNKKRLALSALNF